MKFGLSNLSKQIEKSHKAMNKRINIRKLQYMKITVHKNYSVLEIPMSCSYYCGSSLEMNSFLSGS